MYLEIIDKLFYGTHYERVSSFGIEKFHKSLEKNPTVLKKLNSEVNRGFLKSKQELINWFGFVKMMYAKDLSGQVDSLQPIAVLEVLFKHKRYKASELTKKHYNSLYKGNMTVFNDIKSLCKMERKLMLDFVGDDLEKAIKHLEDKGCTFIKLSNGYFYLSSKPTDEPKFAIEVQI